jgi:hypothetical protein
VTARQLWAWARFVLSDLADAHPWQQLVVEGTISLVAGTQAYNLPSDFGRMVPDTLWDRTQHRQQQIPTTPQEWAYLKGESLVTSMNRRLRIYGNQFVFFDTITAADASNSIKYEYITSNLALNGSTPTTNLTDDSYTARLPEKLVTLGIVYKYRVAKALASQDAYDNFIRTCDIQKGFNTASGSLNMAPYSASFLSVSVPDRSYG